ncbi:MAG TPA: DUF1513 domain-containing protein [Dongiaceae bacterium]|jgi:hypothetical protein
MAIDRRRFLQGAAGLAASAVWPARAGAAEPRFIGCRLEGEDKASVEAFDLGGREMFAFDLPARGHDIALRPGGREAAIFARRPGTWFIVADTGQGIVRARQDAVENRHFFGHGAYSADGTVLYATENDTASGQGVIGIYDATDGYKRIGEFPSRGIGPHDIALLPDGRTLVVANGGLMTLPESGREVLNPRSMRSTIDLLDCQRGELLARFELDPSCRNLSLRHLALTARGDILFGGQYQGEDEELPLLVGIIPAGGGIRLLPMPEDELAALENYIGSVAVDGGSEILAATSPHGSRIAFWSIASGEFIGSHRMGDVCGVAPGPDAAAFVASSGNEGCALLSLPDRTGGIESEPLARLTPRVWDNHLVALS